MVVPVWHWYNQSNQRPCTLCHRNHLCFCAAQTKTPIAYKLRNGSSYYSACPVLLFSCAQINLSPTTTVTPKYCWHTHGSLQNDSLNLINADTWIHVSDKRPAPLSFWRVCSANFTGNFSPCTNVQSNIWYEDSFFNSKIVKVLTNICAILSEHLL